MAADAEVTKETKQFSWTTVDPAVTRAMLICAYEESDDSEQVPIIEKLPKAHLAAQAEHSLGRPPAKRFFTSAMAETLIKTWLPLAPEPVVEKLATAVQAGLSGAAKTQSLNTNKARIKFLGERNHTKNFLANLRRRFLSAHRASHVTVVKPPGVLGDPTGPVTIQGQDQPLSYKPYPHHLQARHHLDELLATGDRFGGRLVLPTGAGKTDTIVGWLVQLMAADASLRVLWLAHQQELLAQAVVRFQSLARPLPITFSRQARRIHAGACSVSTLAKPDLDIAAVTVQSLAYNLNASKAEKLALFLKRPTIVVVDEAHHAGAPNADALLTTIAKYSTVRAIIGLTATPFPTSVQAKVRFKKRFPLLIHQVDAAELIASGILARPVLNMVDTGKPIDLSAADAQRAVTGDLPPATLGELNDPDRNDLVVRTWRERAEAWGKTLVFATNIDHADELTDLFGQAHAQCRVLHSAVTESREEILDWFRSSKESVLVSVGMLTEGVDLPDARTAFLARPTTSRVLLQQMIGRVLRGPKAGGEVEAQVVYFRDQWRNFDDVLDPFDVFGEGGINIEPVTPGQPHLPPILDDQGRIISGDLAHQISRAMESVRGSVDLDDEDTYNDRPLDPHIVSTRVVGYYRLPDRTIAVFDHQTGCFDELLRQCLDGSLKGKPLSSYFVDVPPPYPTTRTLRELVDFTREFKERPEFVALDAQIGPGLAADRILAGGEIAEARRAEIIESVFLNSIARSAFRSLEHFEEAVDRELRDRRRTRHRLNPERPLPAPRPKLPKLPRCDRSLEPARTMALETARRILPLEHASRLEGPPPVTWTSQVVSSTFGHWSLTLNGAARGRQTIRINTLLRSTVGRIPDEMLAYLIYHELLHHLLPGQGHDAEFRELEARWPNAAKWDAEIDTIHEHWDISPPRYNG